MLSAYYERLRTAQTSLAHQLGHCCVLSTFYYINNVFSTALKFVKVSKGAKIKTQDTNEKVTNSQLDSTNGTQEVNPFPAGDQKAV